jgi:hypothetical protein
LGGLAVAIVKWFGFSQAQEPIITTKDFDSLEIITLCCDDDRCGKVEKCEVTIAHAAQHIWCAGGELCE